MFFLSILNIYHR